MTAKLPPATVRALLGRATKGPWRVDGPRWNQIVWSNEGNRICFMAHSNGLNDERDIANSGLVGFAPDLAAAYLEALAVIEEIAGTEWQEMEPASSWIPDHAEGYVGEMESFCNWATAHARAFLAKHKEQEA